jgi:SAM-dependent methyltransferase
VSAPPARYDEIVPFYEDRIGAAVVDPGTSALLDLCGDVAGQRVLELACGQGRVARELAARGASVVGVDLSREMLAAARQTEAADPRGIRFVEGDVTAADLLAGEAFDGVVCNYGLTDIDDLDGTLANVSRLLSRGGWFTFSLLHPCFPGWGDRPSSWPPAEGYRREGWWRSLTGGLRARVGSSHRMLSTYVNALVDHDLVIERLVEPWPDSEEWRRLAPEKAPVPVHLAGRCRRT